tara:strand:- start:3896 stop:4441 length:546 start_codon:yes stop_codon:yes gene_type:complete
MSLSRSSFATLTALIFILLIVGWFTYNKAIERQIASTPAYRALSATTTGSYTDLEGKSVVLTDYVGQVMLVHAWASWCPSCAKELQQLSQIAESYEQDSVVVIAINRAEDRYSAERFLKAHNLDLKVQLILDPDDSFFKSIGGYAMPETIIYNQKGEIVKHIRGDLNQEAVRGTIEETLAQ